MQDNELNMDDIMGCGWESVLKAAKPECYSSMNIALSEASTHAMEENRRSHSKALRLLANACTLRLFMSTPNKPSETLLDLQNPHVPGGFTKADITLFAGVVDAINDPWLKARLAEIVWSEQKPCDRKYAFTAIDSYISIPLDKKTWSLICWKRALDLCRMLGSGDDGRLAKIESLIISILENLKKQDILSGIQLTELLDPKKLKEDQRIRVAEKMESLANEFENDGEFLCADRYFQSSAVYFKNSGKDDKVIELQVARAEALVNEGKTRLSRDKKHRVAASFYKDAIQVFRTIPRSQRSSYQVEQRLLELRTRYKELCEFALKHETMTVIGPGVDTSQLVHSARGMASGKSPEEGLNILVGLHTHSTDGFREWAINHLNSNSSVLNLIPIKVLSHDGRTIGNLNGSDEETIHAQMIQHYCHTIHLVTQGLILPALDLLIQEHNLQEEYFVKLAKQSPVVPEGREVQFGKALYFGYIRDFITSINLLAPQVENLVRFHLKQNGYAAETTTLDSQGIETQKSLSSLIEVPASEMIFGKDQTYEIKTLFCDQFGPNLRNNIGHGLLDDKEYGYARYAWWFGLKLVINNNLPNHASSQGANQ